MTQGAVNSARRRDLRRKPSQSNMNLTKHGGQSSLKQAAMGFALGAVGGCMLGATEGPVEKTLSLMTAAGPLKPLMDAVSMVGPLGLGSLVGAAALTTAMTSVMAGVILAAVVASVFAATRSCNTSHKDSVGLWVSAGLAGAFGTTLSGATFGVICEWIVQSYGMVGLLWTLSIFTIFKPPMRFLFQLLWKQGEVCCSLASSVDWAREREDLETTELQQRQRVTLQIEERILTLDRGGSDDGTDPRMIWATERQQREEIERKKMENEEAEMKQRTIQDWINTIVSRHVDFLAFSGIPMTVVAVITSGFGLVGYGRHQSVFIVLLALVAVIGYYLLKSSDFKYWMLVGCMGMLATFVIALLTLHAGQEALTAATKARAAGDDPPKEAVRTRVNYHSSLEALHAAFFVSRTCQLSMGATVGGALVRRDTGEVKVIAGAALVAGSLLAGVEVLVPVLGEGGTAGALLGIVGAAGVSVGAVAAVAVRWSQWAGTLGTVAGLVVGAVGIGKWHIVNIGLQIPVAYVFAMTNPL